MPDCCSSALQEPAQNGVVGAGMRTLPAPTIALTKFMLEPEEVAALQEQHGLSTLRRSCRRWLPRLPCWPRPPTSAFPVG